MIRAAGILFSAGDQILFVKRSYRSDQGGTWAFPGGHMEAGETTEEAALRESVEELGADFTGGRPLVEWTRTQQKSGVIPQETVDFTTFVCRVPEAFYPTLNDEHTAFTWALASDPPEPLHPGCRTAVDRITWNELDIARAISRGDLTSPQRYENLTLVAIRITGTDFSYRGGINEHVYRNPEIYLTQEFCDRVAGLPVIWEHPPGNVLSSEEYGQRVVGAIMFAYIQDDEVWGIARIQDETAAEMVVTNQLSTSPAVLFRGKGINSRVKMEDGSTLLIEGDPTLIDHIALLPGLGVWDKGGPQSGVLSVEAIAIGDSVMADEEKKVEVEKKADADAGEKLDLILSCLDSVTKRMDVIDGRMDSYGSRMDAWEDIKKDSAKKDGENEPASNGGKEESKAENELAKEEKAEAKGDKGRKDAETEEKADAYADAVSHFENKLSEQNRVIADLLVRLPKDLSDSDYDVLAKAQARADAHYQMHGETAPRPLRGETAGKYRRRLLEPMQKLSKKWSVVDLSKIDDTTLDVIEPDVYADSDIAARTPHDIPDGMLREIVRHDPITNLPIREFFSNGGSYIRQMTSQSKSVVGLNTGNK